MSLVRPLDLGLFTVPVRAYEGGVVPAPGAAPPSHLARATPSRVAEFVAGRRCARAALSDLGAGAEDVGVDARGAPVWPRGFVGSIAHTKRVACAVAAPSARFAGVGIDVEDLLDETTAREVASVALRPEDEAIAGGAPLDVAIAFSAKETVYKCVAPIVGILFDFDDARVTRIASEGETEVVLLTDLGAGFGRGRVLRGRWAVRDGLVLTGMAIERS